jgi:hypothetical protein
MALSLVGAVLLALGLFSGGVLVATALGLSAWSPGASLWVLFPLFSVVGFLLFVVGARTASIRTLSVVASYLLLLLALCSAVGLVLEAASVLEPVGGTLALWYVLAIAGVLGAFGSATHHKATAQP